LASLLDAPKSNIAWALLDLVPADDAVFVLAQPSASLRPSIFPPAPAKLASATLWMGNRGVPPLSAKLFRTAESLCCTAREACRHSGTVIPSASSAWSGMIECFKQLVIPLAQVLFVNNVTTGQVKV
jgi:hypothetical protein